MELVVDVKDDAEGDDLDMLNGKLLQSHLELKGDVVQDDPHQKVPSSPCSVLSNSLVSHDRSGCKLATAQ
jgi:hypothetical protein